MADPRALIHNLGVGNQFMSVKFDSTINLPTVQTPGPGPNVSTDLGKAVTWSNLSTSTYASDADNFAVGFGVSGDPVIGTIIHVDPDGFGSICYQGVVEVLPLASNAPLENGLVAVDGAGKVVASTAAKNGNARCIGFAASYNQALFVNPSGTITPPTTSQQSGSVEYCQIMLS